MSPGFAPRSTLTTNGTRRRYISTRSTPYDTRPPFAAKLRKGEMPGRRRLASRAAICPPDWLTSGEPSWTSACILGTSPAASTASIAPPRYSISVASTAAVFAAAAKASRWLGTSSAICCSHLPQIAGASRNWPVRLPPGLARLAA